MTVHFLSITFYDVIPPYICIRIFYEFMHTYIGPPQQSQALSKVSHVWRGACTLMPHKHTHTHVHAAVWFLTLAKCFYESFVVVEIRSELRPGRAALIMSLLKVGELPALPLSKHHMSYSCEGSPQTP